MYYSEYGQDAWLEENVFKGRQGGVFVESGALDGLLHSNSLFFERERGWTGLLIEPNPVMRFRLRENRPNAEIDYSALSSDYEKLEFESIYGQLYGWSGVPAKQSVCNRERIETRIAAQDRRMFSVEGRPLADILRERHIEKVNFLSLDLEGGELAVLSVFPFNEIPIEVIGVENNSEDIRFDDLLKRNGYRFLTKIGNDELWKI